MDAEQIFATGGATGTVGLVLFLIYKFLTTKHRIRSSCFGKVMEIETEASSPPDKNITVVVENGSNDAFTRHKEKPHYFKSQVIYEGNKEPVSRCDGEGEVSGHNESANRRIGTDEGKDSTIKPVPESNE